MAWDQQELVALLVLVGGQDVEPDPEGQTVHITAAGNGCFGSRWNSCPTRQRCTSAVDGKTFRVGEHDHLLAAARARWRNQTGPADYRQHRPMVERSIAWLVRKGHRRVRYRGVNANRIGFSTRAAAVNLQGIINLGLEHNEDAWHVQAA